MAWNTNNNRFGIFYLIARILLAVLIIVQLVWLIVATVHCFNNHCEANSIVWYAFTIFVLLIGLVGAWKEHFGSSAVFAITEIVLVILGFAMFAGKNDTAWSVAATLIVSVIYSIMLYMSGHKDMGVPEIC